MEKILGTFGDEYLIWGHANTVLLLLLILCLLLEVSKLHFHEIQSPTDKMLCKHEFFIVSTNIIKFKKQATFTSYKENNALLHITNHYAILSI